MYAVDRSTPLKMHQAAKGAGSYERPERIMSTVGSDSRTWRKGSIPICATMTFESVMFSEVSSGAELHGYIFPSLNFFITVDDGISA